MSSFFLSCEDEEPLIEDEEERAEVFQEILSNEQLFNAFINEMSENPQSLEWAHSSESMRRNLYSTAQLQTMLEEDPQMRDSLMQLIVVVMEEDTAMQHSPQMRDRMIRHLDMMMEKDTALAQDLRELVNENPPSEGTN